MRQLIILFLAFSLIIPTAWAQNSEADLYLITDVDVDVTDDSAVQARDQAIIQAQRSAYGQLLDRLGVEPSQATKISDDDLSTLVQNFEVQNERTSSVRYIGVFTVQFRPNAVHNLLGSHLPSTTVTRSNPLLLLPIVNNQGHYILWEESTKWRTAWEKSAHNSGLVPLTLPTGDLDDIALISTDEAVKGKSSSIKALISKYQTAGAVVAILNFPDSTDPHAPLPPNSSLRLDVQRYNVDGNAGSLVHLTLNVVDNNLLDNALLQGIKQIHTELDKQWQQESRNPVKTSVSSPQKSDDEPTSTTPNGPLITLPVTVPLVSLTEWAQIRGRLNSVSSIQRTEVITLARGATNIEITFAGNLTDLKEDLVHEGLSLTQNSSSGGWVLRPDTSGDTSQ